MIMEESNTLSTWEEQTWIRKIRKKLENKNKQGDQEYTAGGRYCKIYKIPLIKMEWSCWRNEKPKNT